MFNKIVTGIKFHTMQLTEGIKLGKEIQSTYLWFPNRGLTKLMQGLTKRSYVVVDTNNGVCPLMNDKAVFIPRGLNYTARQKEAVVHQMAYRSLSSNMGDKMETFVSMDAFTAAGGYKEEMIEILEAHLVQFSAYSGLKFYRDTQTRIDLLRKCF